MAWPGGAQTQMTMRADRFWMMPRRGRRLWLWVVAALLPLVLLVLGLFAPRVATIEIGEASLAPTTDQAAEERGPADSAYSGWFAE